MKSYVLWRINQLLNLLSLNVRFDLEPPYFRKSFRYRPPRPLLRHLGAENLSTVTLRRADGEAALGPLYSTWKTIPGGHKWHHYFEIYESVFRTMGDRPIRMLEIGVNRGGSSKLWKRSLPNGSIYVGIDINPECKAHEDVDQNVFIRIGDQSDAEFLSDVADEFGPFDLILDDGSHVCSHMIASFRHLFLPHLRSPGIYMAEDTHSNFWPNFRDQRYSFLDFSKDLVDLMHAHYFDNASETCFRKSHENRVEATNVPKLAASIKDVRFFDSIVVIHKNDRSALPLSEYT